MKNQKNQNKIGGSQKEKNCASKNCGNKTAAKRKKKITVLSTVATTKNRSQRTPAPTKRALDVFIPPSNTDVNGSWTGKPKNKNEVPVQDADDL